MTLTKNNQVTLSEVMDEIIRSHIRAFKPLLKSRNLRYVGLTYDVATREIFFGLISIEPEFIWSAHNTSFGMEDIEKLIADSIQKMLDDLTARESKVSKGENIYCIKKDRRNAAAAHANDQISQNAAMAKGVPICSTISVISKEIRDASKFLDPYLRNHSKHYKILFLMNQDGLPVLRSENPAAFARLSEKKASSKKLALCGKVTDVTNKVVIIDDSLLISKLELSEAKVGDRVELECFGRIENLSRLVIDERIDLQIQKGG